MQGLNYRSVCDVAYVAYFAGWRGKYFVGLLGWQAYLVRDDDFGARNGMNGGHCE